MNSPDFIILHDLDNVATALRDVALGAPARVANVRGAFMTMEPLVVIRLGHKVALRPIPAGGLVVKHGHPIGRATVDIEAGGHVHVHNVISLSQETDTKSLLEGA